MPRDLMPRLMGSFEVARVDDVDVLRAEAKADRLGLLVASRESGGSMASPTGAFGKPAMSCSP